MVIPQFSYSTDIALSGVVRGDVLTVTANDNTPSAATASVTVPECPAITFQHLIWGLGILAGLVGIVAAIRDQNWVSRSPALGQADKGSMTRYILRGLVILFSLFLIVGCVEAFISSWQLFR